MNIALVVLLIVILVVTGIQWARSRSAPWGALFAVTGLFLMASLGWLWWRVPFVGVALLVLGILIALLFSKSRAGRLLLAAVATLGIVAIVIGGITTATVAGAFDSKANASDDGSSELSEEAKSAITKTLTVKTTSADAECVTDEFGLVKTKVGALESVPNPRKWSDALSTPFKATEAEAVRDELQQTICEDRLLGVSYLTFLATDVRDALKASTGIDLIELNFWMKPYTADPSDINKTAAGFIPLLDVEEPTSSEVDTAMAKNREWQHEALYVNTLLDRFALAGIDARKSVVNYHLAVGGLVVGALPAVERNDKQENLPALIFSITEKGQCEELLSIGANTGDKRPELFKAKDCEAPPTPGTPATPGTPTTPNQECEGDCGEGSPECGGDCGGTPGCEDDCGGEPGCTEHCDGKHDEDSVGEPDGVGVQPNDDFEEPTVVESPAPVRPASPAPDSGSPAQGTDPVEPDRDQGDPATGTTEDGTEGTVTEEDGANGETPGGNPFG